MISLDTNLAYLTKHYQVNSKRANVHAYKSIDDLTQAQAVTGTRSADTDLILEALKLSDPKNRLKIISMLRRNDVMSLLSLIKKEHLVLGLKFFNKEKILKFYKDLPKADLVKMLFKIFKKSEILKFMPVKALRNFISSKKIDKKMLMGSIQGLPPHVLAQIIEAATGQSVANMKPAALLGQINGMPLALLKSGVMALPQKYLMAISSGILAKDPKLFLEFKTKDLLIPFTKCSKDKLAASAVVLEPDKIIRMLGALPDEMLNQVATLIEPDKLADQLESFHGDLLAQLAA